MLLRHYIAGATDADDDACFRDAAGTLRASCRHFDAAATSLLMLLLAAIDDAERRYAMFCSPLLLITFCRLRRCQRC